MGPQDPKDVVGQVARDLTQLALVLTRTQRNVGAATLLTVVSTILVAWVDSFKLLDWFIALAATTVAALLAVASGLYLFHYQDRKAEKRLREKLLTRVALEWKRNLVRLEEGVTTPFVRQRTGERVGEIVTAELSTVALRDLNRSDAFEAKETLAAMRLEGRINAYMQDVEFLLGHFEPDPSAQAVRFVLAEMNERRDLMITDLGDLLQGLREQGLETPD